MSSREIAELTGKELSCDARHSRHAGQLQDDQNWACLRGPGRPTYTSFTCREHHLTLLLGYDVVLRRRWSSAGRSWRPSRRPQLPQTMAQALAMLQSRPSRSKPSRSSWRWPRPRWSFVDRYVQASMGFREVCKLLGANEHEFSEFLARAKIMYRLAGKMTPHAEHLAAGRFKVKTGTAPRNEHAYAQASSPPRVWRMRACGASTRRGWRRKAAPAHEPFRIPDQCGHPVAYYPRLARFFGSVNVAILFAQLHYWSQRGESDLGTHKSSEQFTEETGLSYREQVTARKQLREAGFLIETHRRLSTVSITA
jgi:phage antirepressor YoqD-like protein